MSQWQFILLSLFNQKDTRQHTNPATHVPTEKKHKNCERYKLNIIYCGKYDDVKLLADNTR